MSEITLPNGDEVNEFSFKEDLLKYFLKYPLFVIEYLSQKNKPELSYIKIMNEYMEKVTFKALLNSDDGENITLVLSPYIKIKDVNVDVRIVAQDLMAKGKKTFTKIDLENYLTNTYDLPSIDNDFDLDEFLHIFSYFVDFNSVYCGEGCDREIRYLINQIHDASNMMLLYEYGFDDVFGYAVVPNDYRKRVDQEKAPVEFTTTQLVPVGDTYVDVTEIALKLRESSQDLTKDYIIEYLSKAGIEYVESDVLNIMFAVDKNHMPENKLEISHIGEINEKEISTIKVIDVLIGTIGVGNSFQFSDLIEMLSVYIYDDESRDEKENQLSNRDVLNFLTRMRYFSYLSISYKDDDPNIVDKIIIHKKSSLDKMVIIEKKGHGDVKTESDIVPIDEGDEVCLADDGWQVVQRFKISDATKQALAPSPVACSIPKQNLIS